MHLRDLSIYFNYRINYNALNYINYKLVKLNKWNQPRLNSDNLT